MAPHNGQKFSAKDKDVDAGNQHCAQDYKGGRSCFIICNYLLTVNILFSSNHHCCSFQGVLIAFPCLPVDTIGFRLVVQRY
jgi:hypothetical protein